MQWKIVDSVLNQRRDNCVVMATGKYQVLSLYVKVGSVSCIYQGLHLPYLYLLEISFEGVACCYGTGK